MQLDMASGRKGVVGHGGTVVLVAVVFVCVVDVCENERVSV